MKSDRLYPLFAASKRIKVALKRPLMWGMSQFIPISEQVIDASVLTIEVLREICGAELSEEAVDKLLCSAYREFIGSSLQVGAQSDG